MSDGKTVDAALVKEMTKEELQKIKASLGEEKYKMGQFKQASSIFEDLMTRHECPDFLTLVAYDHID